MMRLTLTKLSQVRASIFIHTNLHRIAHPNDFPQKCKKKLLTRPPIEIKWWHRSIIYSPAHDQKVTEFN